MTIIIYKDRTMYSDEVVLYDENYLITKSTNKKIHRVEREDGVYLVGLCGNACTCVKFLNRFKKNYHIDDFEIYNENCIMLIYSEKDNWLREYSVHGYIELDINYPTCIGMGKSMADAIFAYDQEAVPEKVIKSICKISKLFEGFNKVSL